MSVIKIEQDHGRFRQIVRGKIKENLRRYVTQAEMLVPKGRGAVTDGGLELEIFYANTFRRHRCIDGDPGRSAVEKRAAPLPDGGINWVWFDGGAVQRFVDESL